MSDHSFTLGEHAASIKELRDDVAEMKADMKLVLSYMAERRGERKGAAWVAGVVGSVASVLVTVGLKLADYLLSRLT